MRPGLEPVLGAVNPAEVSPPLVRSRRADKLAAGTGPTTVAKARGAQGARGVDRSPGNDEGPGRGDAL
ncbi:hypothetical protein WKI68_29700 [Streptomyces sp. MS1.HAVA.3]|uniref:Uncharacterized protein n=1 Tax=Streptomyces caledonius TaxID=3134107 RepID=A0ABU8U918_9ACTN